MRPGPARRRHFAVVAAAVAAARTGRPFKWFNAALSCRSSFFASLAFGSFGASFASFASFVSLAAAAVFAGAGAVAVADLAAAGPAITFSVGFAALPDASPALLS